MPPFVTKTELTEDHPRLHPSLSKSNLLALLEDSGPRSPIVPPSSNTDSDSYWSWPSTEFKEDKVTPAKPKKNVYLSKKAQDVMKNVQHLPEAEQYWYGM
uniref:Uncharacterized protein n=1 Tax=Corethron hystrix TaxID=216773 RepID=A0A7S1BKA0_9STRA|mmetsp:Transcript_28949/g.66281  ORF Transcript_28949/g.66281 Transcript_28949/m.66281 type:complete len:100 (+) Transcript_28949:250-549(+)